MPDQVPVVPADGAVAVAVDPPVVTPLALADAAGDNNAQNANNDNMVPVPQPAAQEVSVFSCPCIRFPSQVFWVRRCWSFSLVLACLIGFSFCVCATILFSCLCYNFSFGICVQIYFSRLCTTLVFCLCGKFSFCICITNLVFASLFQLSFLSV